jgi:type I restriction enzyme S subunit
MNNWQNVVIDDCCDILDHLRIPVNGQDRQTMIGDIPYYGANGLQGYINDFIFDEDLILIAEDGGNFEEHDTRPIAYKISGKSWVNNHAHILRAKSEYCQDYIFYSLVNKNIVRFIAGGTRSKLNKSELIKIPIYCPINLSEQQKIAKILSTTDNVIEKTHTAITKYKAIKQGMLNDLFTRGIDIKTGKLRPKYEDAPELYKASELGWIPHAWREGKLIDFADENIHHSFTGGPFGSDLQTKHYTNTGVRIIQLQNIGDGIFNDEYKIYTSEERANYLINCNIYHGEIIISKMAAPIARACIIPKNEKRYLMASDGIRLSIDKKKFNSRFVMETINHKRFRNIAELKATGSTRARIGLTELREITVANPVYE